MALPSKHEKSIAIEAPFIYSDHEIKLVVDKLIMHNPSLNNLPNPSHYLNLDLNKYREPFEFNNRLFCYFNGKKFSLSFERDLDNGLYSIEHNEIFLKEISKNGIRSAIKRIYIDHLSSIIPNMLDKWVYKMNLEDRNITVRYGGRAYGLCHYYCNTIDLSTILGAFPDKCIEEVLLHELVHFFIPKHNKEFYSLMDHLWPEWRQWRLDSADELQMLHNGAY